MQAYYTDEGTNSVGDGGPKVHTHTITIHAQRINNDNIFSAGMI